ncbi:MAG: ATP-dependent Clp protease proteolytic subunit [Oscillospiraceae bacterium]|nr:ATP-dependent Clp protease proteolytic subunit [Oscillospiraceae bacterium]
MDEEKRDGAAELPSPQGEIHLMTIIGQIEGHTALPAQSKATRYEHVLPELAAVEESPEIRGLLLILNTIGGDVEAGLAIAEMIAGMRTPTASLVLGGGHSIGVPLAVAAQHSFIVPSASMTIHPVRFSGVLVGAPQSFDYLSRIQERILGFITSHSRISDADLRACLSATGELACDIGTSLSGREAVSLGLIDTLGGLSDALAWLHARMREQ